MTAAVINGVRSRKFKMTEKQWDALFTISPYVLETKETAIWMPTESILKGNHHNIQGNTEEALAAADTLLRFLPPGDDQSAPLQKMCFCKA